jgi:glucose/arabinose dehydrogenase
LKRTYRNRNSWGAILALAMVMAPVGLALHAQNSVARGQGKVNDYTEARPGTRHLITTADLPAPGATPAVANRSNIVPKPENAWPQVVPGFKVERLATGLEGPRQIEIAPNGDLFIAETEANQIRVIRLSADGKVQASEVFATGLRMPFGIAFYPAGPNPQYVYIGNTDAVVRFRYKNGDLKASGAPEKIADLPGGRSFGGGHWTRDLLFSKDGKKLYVAVGSKGNVSDAADENERADVLEFNPDGSGRRIFASGLRNVTGMALHPTTNQIWVTVNERDGLGDNLVPDYATHIVDGGFYGWPWYYLGQNHDPRMKERPDLKSKVIVPDVLFQSHSAPLSIVFYTGDKFPKEYSQGAFVTLHGSWNRANLTGYKVVYVPAPNGKATGEYVDFITGFTVNNKDVWGRPVGIQQAKDGSLVFTDDASDSLWRVTYQGGGQEESRR